MTEEEEADVVDWSSDRGLGGMLDRNSATSGNVTVVSKAASIVLGSAYAQGKEPRTLSKIERLQRRWAERSVWVCGFTIDMYATFVELAKWNFSMGSV